jgi:hypothetical protein
MCREGSLLEPREIRVMSMEQAGDGIDQDTEGRLSQLTAGLAQ